MSPKLGRALRHTLGGALAVWITVAAAVLSSDRTTSSATPRSAAAGRCGAGQREDSARSSRVSALLATTTTGRDLLRHARAPLRVCFTAAAESVVTTAGTITLLNWTTDAETAARLGHLLRHVVAGPPLPEGFDRARSCRSVVADAIAAEAQAYALELQLRRELGHRGPGYPFERDFWDAPPARRVELLRTFFRARPAGVVGVPGLVSGVPGLVNAYTARCHALQDQSRAAVPR